MAKKKPTSTPKPARKLSAGDAIPDDVAQLFAKHQKYLAAGRANYSKADRVLEQILEQCEPGVEITLEATGRRPPQLLTLVDQFADANAVWSGSSCKRLTIKAKDVKPQDR